MWKEHLQNLTQYQTTMFGELSSHYKVQDVSAEHDDNQVEHWLSQKMLLVNIPFQYLIPSPEMLPSNSIRFFYINNNWLKSLLDGSISIGRTNSVNVEHDMALIDSLLERAKKKSQFIRPILQKRAPDEQVIAQDLVQTGGFLLRSPLVRGWRGLQFSAFNSQGGKIEPLRIETLSEDILIAIYYEMPFRVEIAQPPEGLHFGLNLDSVENEKAMRDFITGKILDPQVMIPVPMKNKQYRTVDIIATQQNIAHAFGMQVSDITSAEFALQMIKSPYKGVVSIHEKK